jgi:hypothetical protein
MFSLTNGMAISWISILIYQLDKDKHEFSKEHISKVKVKISKLGE